MTAPRTLRVGVVGIGYGQAVLVPAFRADSGCEVTAIAASTRERAARVAERLGVTTALGDWRELVADPRIDAVAVAVPPRLQPQVVIAAAEAGKHVFCEKPAALTVADARAMRKAAEHVVHAIDFEFPELPAWRALATALGDARVGEIARVYVDVRVKARAPDGGRSAWKASDAEGGALWGGFLPHALYHLEWIGGPLRRVRARGTLDRRAVQLWGEYASGASAVATLDAGATFGSGHRIEISGTAAMALLENTSTDHAGPFTLSLDRAVLYAEDPIGAGDGRVRAVAPLAHRFLEAIRGHGRMTPDLSDGVRVQELLDAVERAMRDDAWVSA